MTPDESDRLAALFLKSAQATPDRVAVRDSGGAWTYDEVAAAASDLAERLTAAGVAPGDRVGVMAARRAGGPVAILAVLWSGAAYVPITPGWPAARRAAVLEGAQARLVLAVDAEQDTPEGVRRMDLTTPELLQARSAAPSSPRPRPHPGAAYVIFTSGSTGAPKGVEVRSAGAAGLVASVVSLTGMGPDSVFVALSDFAFDISVFEIFAPWSVGGELVIAAELQILANQLGPLLEAPGRRPFLQTTPTVLERLLQAGLELPSDTVLLLAGERLRRSLVAQVAHVEQVWNLYGPTEATIYATAHACLPPAPDDAEPDLPIGTPVNGAVAEIRPLSDGSSDGSSGSSEEVGELLIGGPGVALGYCGRPDLTAERFLDGGARYATGDVVRRRADGLLVHAGRLDRQVKIRGNRVELDEVEGALADLAGHGRVAVRMDVHGVVGPHLAAFVADPHCDVLELRRRLADRLPAYMVPTRIYQVPEIPTTSSGKTDHSSLRAPEESGAWDDAVFATLSKLWERHLGTPAAPDGNFYVLGGHESTASQIATGLAAAHDIEVDITVILRNPALSDLAAAVTELVRTQAMVRTPTTHD
ncbi:amino acid adenylation domain-containing protein [Streptomyces sp. bgisy130]|uniref:amino acid adenylation domain-containing protein n=1 Tax=Streptomyces sp. bgisy130 TaxID=3413788 RepID=UPI003F49B4C1